MIPQLLQKGWTVRCLVRDPARLASGGWEHAEVYTGDVLAAETLLPALQGVSVAYYLVHSMTAGERGFAERDLLAAQQFGRAAQAAGVKRIIYLGGWAVRRIPSLRIYTVVTQLVSIAAPGE